MLFKNRTIYRDYLSLSLGSAEELTPSCSLWQHMGWAVKDHKGATEKSGSREHCGFFFSPAPFACHILTPRFTCPWRRYHIAPHAAGYGVSHPCIPQFVGCVGSLAGVSASHSGQEPLGAQPSPI